VLYFAYGSNMNEPQFAERCPTARFVGIATLRDHRLLFTRKSINRGCGVADAVAAQGHRMWGVVYEVPDADLPKLDRSEGFRPGRPTNSYWRRDCVAFLDDDDGRPISAFTYFAERQPEPPLPNQAYKDLIVVGARRWSLPAHYIAELERIEVDL
jgi:cation transport regulator ChaC